MAKFRVSVTERRREFDGRPRRGSQSSQSTQSIIQSFQSEECVQSVQSTTCESIAHAPSQGRPADGPLSPLAD